MVVAPFASDGHFSLSPHFQPPVGQSTPFTTPSQVHSLPSQVPHRPNFHHNSLPPVQMLEVHTPQVSPYTQQHQHLTAPFLYHQFCSLNLPRLMSRHEQPQQQEVHHQQYHQQTEHLQYQQNPQCQHQSYDQKQIQHHQPQQQLKHTVTSTPLAPQMYSTASASPTYSPTQVHPSNTLKNTSSSPSPTESLLGALSTHLPSADHQNDSFCTPIIHPRSSTHFTAKPPDHLSEHRSCSPTHSPSQSPACPHTHSTSHQHNPCAPAVLHCHSPSCYNNLPLSHHPCGPSPSHHPSLPLPQSPHCSSPSRRVSGPNHHPRTPPSQQPNLSPPHSSPPVSNQPSPSPHHHHRFKEAQRHYHRHHSQNQHQGQNHHGDTNSRMSFSRPAVKPPPLVLARQRLSSIELPDVLTPEPPELVATPHSLVVHFK